ncbi:MAG TPA: hypothetical protein VGV39_11740 [Mesorhizobium sp.]|uniref:hypothetical protein n=1 Tax=Mesorhizobium sp. TaxID=1871066 RepID=UPI002DDCF365|nr:hypothetical protein [Mesorhizobium sp.]HEV2503742.1 hypothetical protein [Mesorhizobium sp.]
MLNLPSSSFLTLRILANLVAKVLTILPSSWWRYECLSRQGSDRILLDDLTPKFSGAVSFQTFVKMGKPSEAIRYDMMVAGHVYLTPKTVGTSPAIWSF